jgi:ribosomal protein L16/L10AE
MGKGKGLVDKWVYSARKSRIIFEMSRQQFKLPNIRTLFRISSIKLPVKTKLIFQRYRMRRENLFLQPSTSHKNKYNIQKKG